MKISPTLNEVMEIIAGKYNVLPVSSEILSNLGVTGTRSEIKTDLASIVKVIRENGDVPCAIGFGILTPEQAKKMAAVSDGAIVGSAIIKLLEKYGKAAPRCVGEYVKSTIICRGRCRSRLRLYRPVFCANCEFCCSSFALCLVFDFTLKTSDRL